MVIDGQKLPKNGVVIAEKALNQPINHTDSLIRYIALDGISWFYSFFGCLQITRKGQYLIQYFSLGVATMSNQA